MNDITKTKRTFECRAYRMETYCAFLDIEAETPQQAMELLKQREDGTDCEYCDSEPDYELVVLTGDGQLTHEEPQHSLYAQRELVRVLVEALEAQAMADADPEASKRKGYYDHARELRIAALTKAGRTAY